MTHDGEKLSEIFAADIIIDFSRIPHASPAALDFFFEEEEIWKQKSGFRMMSFVETGNYLFNDTFFGFSSQGFLLLPEKKRIFFFITNGFWIGLAHKFSLFY